MNYQLGFRNRYRFSEHDGISLPVALLHAGRRVALRASLDTGASVCVFQRRHGEDLNLNVEAGFLMRISTVTGTFNAYAHEVTIEVLDMKVEATVYFAPDAIMPRDVLGRTGWLDRVRLGLVHHDEQIYLSHYDD